ncbi:hypothetical protein IAT40_006105 [Kwoniella sp. CBS 6097]
MAQQPPAQRERLDVESPEAREARLGNLLSSISPTSPGDGTSGSGPTSPVNPLPSRPSALPESDVLARVRAFLPQFQAANEQLLARAADDPESVNIEKVDGDRAIAMDLGLGVLDAPQNSTSNLGPVVDSQIPEGMAEDENSESEDSSDEDSSDSDSESDSEDGSADDPKKASPTSSVEQSDQAA